MYDDPQFLYQQQSVLQKIYCVSHIHDLQQTFKEVWLKSTYNIMVLTSSFNEHF